MPEVVRTVAGVPPRPVGVKPPLKPVGAPISGLTLPRQPSATSSNINDFHFLIHGEKKVGKSTLAMAEPGVLLLTFDPIRKSYAYMQRYCPNWATLKGYVDLLEADANAGKYQYSRVVIDGADIWYRCCQTWVEKKLSVDHVSEVGWARGWDLLASEASTMVNRLMALPGGCWFVCHSNWQEIKTRSGAKVEKLVPLIKARGEEIVVGRVDGWFAYDYYGKERVLILLGDEVTGAGHNFKQQFLTTDGRPVREVPMGNDEFEGWANLKAAFANQQPFATLLERDQKGGKVPAGIVPKGVSLRRPLVARPGIGK